MITGTKKKKILVSDIQGNIFSVSRELYESKKHLFTIIKDKETKPDAENKMIKDEGVIKELRFEDAYVGEDEF